MRKATIGDLLAEAKEDHESVIEFTRDLVTTPSRGGLDPYDPVLDKVRTWLAHRDLPVATLKDKTGATVGLTCEIAGTFPGPRWVLDTCLDTAPFGDEDAWTHPPTSAQIADGWMTGRGSADSKSGTAIFCHIAARLAAAPRDWHGTLVLLCDVDEHTGGSLGVLGQVSWFSLEFVQLNGLVNDLNGLSFPPDRGGLHYAARSAAPSS